MRISTSETMINDGARRFRTANFMVDEMRPRFTLSASKSASNCSGCFCRRESREERP